MNKSKIIISLLVTFIIIIPPATGYFLSTQVTKKFLESAKNMDVEENGYKFSLKSFKLGYLKSRYVIEAEFRNGRKYSIPVVAKNIPDLESLKDMQFKFKFGGKLPEAEVALKPKAVTSLGPDLNKISFNGISAKGAFYLPKGLEIIFLVDSVSSGTSLGKISGLSLKAKSLTADSWETTGAIQNINFKSPMGTVDINKISLSGVIDKNRFNSDLNFEVQSSFFSFPRGVRFTTKADLEFKDLQTLEMNELDKAAKSDINAKFLAQLFINDSLLEGNIKFDLKNPKNQNQEPIFNANGELKLDLVEKDRGVGPFPFLVKMLESQSEEMMDNYKIDLKKNPIIVPLKFVNNDVFINGVRYFSCSPMSLTTPKLSVSKISEIPLTQIKEDAVEDLLLEEDRVQLAESYCRLKYAHEVRDAKDPELALLMELIDARMNFKMLDGIDLLFEQKKKAISESAKDQKVSEELRIISNVLPCYISNKSATCSKNATFLAYEGTEHKLAKLIKLYLSDNYSLEDLNAYETPQDRPTYLRKIYSFFRMKLSNKLLFQKQITQFIKENIASAAPDFSRNLVRYENAILTCKSSGQEACIDLVENKDPTIGSTQVRSLYLDYKVSSVNLALMNNPLLSCRQLLDDLWIKATGAKAAPNIFTPKPDWWQNHAGLAYTESECKKKETK